MEAKEPCATVETSLQSFFDAVMSEVKPITATIALTELDECGDDASPDDLAMLSLILGRCGFLRT